MNGTTVLALGLIVIACLLAIYQARRAEWNTGQKIGTGLFFLGAITGIFLDKILMWSDPIGALIMLIGLIVAWQSQSPSSSTN